MSESSQSLPSQIIDLRHVGKLRGERGASFTNVIVFTTLNYVGGWVVGGGKNAHINMAYFVLNSIGHAHRFAEFIAERPLQIR